MFVTTRVENITLREMSQTQQDKYQTIPFQEEGGVGKFMGRQQNRCYRALRGRENRQRLSACRASVSP